ncbi:hypothetical protein GGI21_003456 [Coemansia aciculifera]|uniref:Uncharacterized protein n=1 Tax=Coemansia aciculifera TaxID=417176 RepID=A0ACC1LU07_9FUNG|nr:hypothetical protein IWW38_006059 [Coemansia aciculifera]KAJ2907869.1 hypothetical protein GGI21_003456 [Coemansia aciculifera]
MKWVIAYLTAITMAVFTSSTVAALVNDICQGHTDAKTTGMPFAHPTVCNQFLTCSADGTPYVGLCPAGTFYDIKLTTCTAAAKDSCGDRK